MSDFQRGSGVPAINDFTAKVTFFNCLEPMHPTLSTAELDIVIKNFELQFGLPFVKGILQIMNSITMSFDKSDDAAF